MKRICASLLFVLAASASAGAQQPPSDRAKASSRPQADKASYPDKPLRFICPFPPGGAADRVTRMLAQHLTDTLAAYVVRELARLTKLFKEAGLRLEQVR